MKSSEIGKNSEQKSQRLDIKTDKANPTLLLSSMKENKMK